MNWINLTSESGLESIIEASSSKPQLIYKHSITCGTSHHVKSMLEDADTPEGIDFHYLDLLANRALSNKIATVFHVHHESPQVLLIRDGKCVYHTSHMAIRMDKIEKNAAIIA